MKMTEEQSTQAAIIATFATFAMAAGFLLGYLVGIDDGREDGCRGQCQVVNGRYEVIKK